MKWLVILFLSIGQQLCSAQIFSTINAKVEFVSEAPLEIIAASSDQLLGVLDMEEKIFAFKLFVKSFEGFNNALQQSHFYENYMEVDEFPIATFKGKVLEDLTIDRVEYRAKGTLTIHGVQVEKIINIVININEKEVAFKANLPVLLEEFDIDLPRIVYQKIAEEIDVKIEGILRLKE